jgi:hypothetical protein
METTTNDIGAKILSFLDMGQILVSIDNIGTKYNLEESQRENFAYLVGTVLLGDTHPKDFIPSLERELKISNEVARAIATEVNKKIFAPVKDLLIEMYQLGGTQEEGIQTNEDIDPRYLEPIPTGVAAVIPEGLSEKNYHTSHELFEQKLKQSIIQRPVDNKVVVEPMKQEPRPIDPYKEDTAVPTPGQVGV